MNKDLKEGQVAKEIEEETAKVPFDIYLWTAVTAMGALKLLKIKLALFVGQWASPIFNNGLI